MVLILFVVFSFFCFCACIQLNGSEYAKMPPVYHLDRYDECFFDPGGLYCDVNFELVSEEYSPLLDIIQQYSSENKTRYNHSKLGYGICVTRTCKNTTGTNDTKLHLESCLNDTFWKRYKLRTRVKDMLYCSGDDVGIDVADVVVAAVILAIIAMNIVGSLCDICGVGKGFCKDILLCFSIFGNWKRLVTFTDDDTAINLSRLKVIDGIKVISVVLVIYVHSLLPVVSFIENPQYPEQQYNNYIFYIVFNGTIVIQSFFIVSGCLLVIKFCSDSENGNNIYMLPKYLFFRWLSNTITIFFT